MVDLGGEEADETTTWRIIGGEAVGVKEKPVTDDDEVADTAGCPCALSFWGFSLSLCGAATDPTGWLFGFCFLYVSLAFAEPFC